MEIARPQWRLNAPEALPLLLASHFTSSPVIRDYREISVDFPQLARFSVGAVPPQLFTNILAGFAFVIGAIVGSFLNVCIYRLPRQLSVNKPRRSFCPSCEKQIPWYLNIPLLSWLMLGGKCRFCKSRIPFRYFLVELLTALLFLAIWLKFVPPGQIVAKSVWILVAPYWVFLGLMIVATFIDFEFFIIPDEITWGGAIVGLIFSLAIPLLHQETEPIKGLAWGLVGAASGFILLYAVVVLGKKAFGRKRISFKEPTRFTWDGVGTPPEKDAKFVVGDESYVWSEFFVEKEQVTMKCGEVTVDGREFREATVIATIQHLKIGSVEFDLDKIQHFEGKVESLVFDREAMGFGDVKFITAIGAFLGWKGVLFTVFSASVVGALIGGATLLFGKKEWSAKVPFGPYLSLGALLWIFIGPQVVSWYFGLIPRY